MKSDQMAILFKDFSNMLLSGIGLEHSLRTLSETAVDKDARRMCAQSLVELERGTSLAGALGSFKVLPREALLAVGAGEQAGELPVVLAMLGEYFEVKAEIKRKVLSALGYPLVVMGILSGVLLYVAFDVFPKIAILLPAENKASSATVLLLGAASFMKEYGLLCAAIFMLLSAGIAFYIRLRPGFLHQLAARIPLINQVMKEQELSLGFFALFLLQKSGVPLDTALREASRVAGGLTERHMEDCASYLVGGLAFSEAVRRDTYFPRFTADTLRVGEESGRFEEYFERLYKTFYRSFRSRMEYLSEAVRPALLVLSAGFIMLIAIGFLQPLYGNLTSIAAP